MKKSAFQKKCVETVQRLVELKGGNSLETVEKMRGCVEGYGKALEAVENLAEILKLISESESKVAIKVDAGFARGLEYYTGAIFEVTVPELDISLAGGGRYDKLIELFGGEPTPAVGIAHGLDRIMLAMQKQGTKMDVAEAKRVVVIPTREELKTEALKIANKLRGAGIPVEVEVMGRKISKALEDADRRKMDYAIIIGEKELREGAVVLRDLSKREQNNVKIEELAEKIKS